MGIQFIYFYLFYLSPLALQGGLCGYFSPHEWCVALWGCFFFARKTTKRISVFIHYYQIINLNWNKSINQFNKGWDNGTQSLVSLNHWGLLLNLHWLIQTKSVLSFLIITLILLKFGLQSLGQHKKLSSIVLFILEPD